MALFDYTAEAELYSVRSRAARRAPLGYKRFAVAADAIRYAIEELAPQHLLGAHLEVDGERFDGAGIKALYANDDYPLPRSVSVAEPTG
jgi:hypothetical protein